MSLPLRACAALLLPFLLASGNAVAYSQLRCRDGSVRETCCCARKSSESPPVGPSIARSCCVVETVQVDRAPGSEARRSHELPAPVHAFVADLPVRAPPALAARPPVRLPPSDAGPPILLKTCTLLS